MMHVGKMCPMRVYQLPFHLIEKIERKPVMKTSATSLYLFLLFLLSLCTCLSLGGQKNDGTSPKYITDYPPAYFTASDKFPPHGKYVSEVEPVIAYPVGIQLRHLVIRDLTHVGAPPPLSGNQTYGFSATVDMELSMDGGVTWNMKYAPASVSVYMVHSSDTGSVRHFDTEMLALNIGGGNLPPGMMIRESPTRISPGVFRVETVTGGYMISSFFDIFTEVTVDGGATWGPGSDPFKVELESPLAYNFPSDNYPPLTGIYESEREKVTMWANGMMMKNIEHKHYTQSFPPPALGANTTMTFGATIEFDLSTDGGLTWINIVAPTSDHIYLNHTDDDGVASFFDIEMQGLNISGGNLPMGMMIRESPTISSTGRLCSRSTGGGYSIDSFFDIFTEVSVDGGMTWSPSKQNTTLELNTICGTITLSPPTLPDGDVGVSYSQTITASGGTPPYTFTVTSGTPPTNCNLSTSGVLSGTPTEAGFFNFAVQAIDSNGCAGTLPYSMKIYPPEYFTASDDYPPYGKHTIQRGDWVLWPMGIIMRNIVIRDLSHVGNPPPLNGSAVYPITVTVDYEISLDGGNTWNHGTSPGVDAVRLTHSSDDGSIEFYDTEMLQFDLSGGDLPAGILVRESPTRTSTGMLKADSATGGYMISSFFDIFTELSVDGGQTWWPATNALSIEWGCSPESPFASDNYPPATGIYESEKDKMTYWATGVMIKNLQHYQFTNSNPLPPLGMNNTFSFGADCEFDISFDGGMTWTHTSSSTMDQIYLNHRDDDAVGSFFDTEMLLLNISGGSLPPGVMLRESPTRASSGRMSVRPFGSGYRISSFFDVFFEISLDMGMTWSPALMNTTMELSFICPDITLSPPTLPDGERGTYYNQTISASGGTPPYTYSIVSGMPPSGCTLSSTGVLSGVPTTVGTSKFTVEAVDSNGCFVDWTYAVTVYPPEHFAGSDLYPPIVKFLSEEGDMIVWTNGVMHRNVAIRDLSHVGPLPPPAGVQVYTLPATVDFQISYDAGQTWSNGTAPAVVTIAVTQQIGVGAVRYFDTEMLQLDISGGDLPPMMLIRESPTLQSKGKMRIAADGGGYQIASFFDIFTEISMDGGLTWSPGNSIIVNSMCPEERLFAADTYPPAGRYVSDMGKTATFATGVIVKNLRHFGFTASTPLPPLGSNWVHNFGGSCYFDMSTDGGLTWSLVLAPTTEAIQVRHTDDDVLSRFYHAEILQSDISGGGLPSGMMFRESPTRSSTGSISVRSDAGGYWIESFFDIFTELSVDGGSTWLPCTNGPTYLYLKEGPQTLHVAIDNKWNMVSVPSIVDDYSATALFPTAVSSAYRYASGYIAEGTLANRVGYWLKFNGNQVVDIIGYPILCDSIPVVQGWNMIGSISYPIPVSSITANPPTLTTSQFFGYYAGYSPADTIVPGKSYWVKASESGYLYLCGTSVLLNKMAIVPTSEQPPPPPRDEAAATVREIPKMYSLDQNYPNPFNPTTVVKYALPVASKVRLVVYDVLGRMVKTLVDEVQDAGYQSISWSGGAVSSGLYFYRIEATSVSNPATTFTDIRKMILIK
jgi:hypothetical protein